MAGGRFSCSPPASLCSPAHLLGTPSVSRIPFSWPRNPSWERTSPRERAESEATREGLCGVGSGPSVRRLSSADPGALDRRPRRCGFVICQWGSRQNSLGVAEDPARGGADSPVAEMLSWKRSGLSLTNKTMFRSGVTEWRSTVARGIIPSRPWAEPRIQPLSPETGGLVQKRPGR